MTDQALLEAAQAVAARLAEPSDQPGQLAQALAELGRLNRLVEAAGIELAGRVTALWESEADKPKIRKLGERSPHMVLQAYAGLDAATAHAWCRVGSAIRPQVSLLGQLLPSPHEAVASALAEGSLRVGGAERILAVVAEIEPYSSPDERRRVEDFLLEQAPLLTDRQFARVCNSIPPKFEPEDLAERETLRRAKCGVDFRRRQDGLGEWRIITDPVGEGFIRAALDACTSPRRVEFSDSGDTPTAADTRPLRQRRLDAIVAIVRKSLGDDNGRVAGVSVAMRVTMTLEGLLRAIGQAHIEGVDQPIPASVARRLAADAEIIPVVLNSQSEPIDMGRAVRLATEPQRNALAIRDGGCIWPMCEMPPGWCEVAHVIPWALGGPTDLDNMMLLCAFHHRCFDNDDWQLQHIDGERYLIPPAWVDSARTPRRAGKPHELAA